MKAIIVTGGTKPSKKLLSKEISSENIIIAADSGANCLWKYQITPDYLIGDLDSIDKKILDFFVQKNITIEQHPCNKNLTDAQLALNKAITLGAKEIVLLGCLGGKRTDHILGAIGLLDTCINLNISASLKDDHQIITLLNQSTTIYCENKKSSYTLQSYQFHLLT